MASCEIIKTEPMLLGINLEHPFPLGFGTLEYLPRVLLKITALDKGRVVTGIGEASIDFPFATYDAWDIYWALAQIDMVGREPNSLGRGMILRDQHFRDSLLGTFPAAFTSLNMALDDVVGKIEGQSVLDMYRQRRKGGRALASIAFQDETAFLLAEVEGKYQQGYIPKPKVGQGRARDTATIEAVSRLSVQKQIPFVLDFNAQYDPEEFGLLVHALESRGVDLSRLLFIEQPTNELSGVPGLVHAKNTLEQCGFKINIVADESFVTLDDAIRCTMAGISLNFKIHKIGGLYHAREIEQVVLGLYRREGKNMLGGTFPTAIGRVYDQQAAAVLETTTLPSDGWEPSTDWFSDEKHLVAESFPVDPHLKEFVPIKGPGLGITPNWSKIESFTIDNPKKEYRKIRSGESGGPLKIDIKHGSSYPEVYFERTGRSPDWNL